VTVEEIDREAESFTTSSAAAALGLPPRQAEVLHWMSQGKSYPEIAAILGLSLHTVHDHTGALFRRLGVRDRRSAVHRLRDAERTPPGLAGSDQRPDDVSRDSTD
jgi:LuxR family quorum-sensing system transcriptional regulator ExpR